MFQHSDLEASNYVTFSRANSIRLMLFSMNGILLAGEVNRATPTNATAAKSPSASPWRAGASCFEQGGVIQGLSAALWEIILLGAKLAIDPRPIGRQ